MINLSEKISFTGSKNVIFIQTSDDSYWNLGRHSSRTVYEYCTKNDYSFKYYKGIHRGYYPWHAAYNRIPILKKFLTDGFSGWLCYLDADAYIYDLDFDLDTYLAERTKFSIIAASDMPRNPDRDPCYINDGVFFLNFSHPVTRTIVEKWNEFLDNATDTQFKNSVTWGQGIHDDQAMLHIILKELLNKENDFIYLNRIENMVLNYLEGTFIRQSLRVDGDLHQREDIILKQIKSILSSSVARRIYGELAASLYRVFLLREPEANGLRGTVDVLMAGRSIDENFKNLFSSPEFQEKKEIFLKTHVLK